MADRARAMTVKTAFVYKSVCISRHLLKIVSELYPILYRADLHVINISLVLLRGDFLYDRLLP